MSPRKSRYRVPEWLVQSFRKKRKKLLFGPYSCPKCKQDKLRIRVDRHVEDAFAICDCGLKYQFRYVACYELVDYYNKLIDHFYNEK